MIDQQPVPQQQGRQYSRRTATVLLHGWLACQRHTTLPRPVQVLCWASSLLGVTGVRAHVTAAPGRTGPTTAWAHSCPQYSHLQVRYTQQISTAVFVRPPGTTAHLHEVLGPLGVLNGTPATAQLRCRADHPLGLLCCGLCCSWPAPGRRSGCRAPR